MLCLKCNSEHDGTFGSGRFCCRSCANSNTKSPETKNKISESMKVGIANGNISTGNTKGMKLSPRSDDHRKKISSHRIDYWDNVGRVTDEHKSAKNKAGVNAYRAKKRNATPDDADMKLIREIYDHCPIGYEVDHIVPLSKGGLHHQDNLQYLPGLENRKKSNKTDYITSVALNWHDVIQFL